MMTPDSSRYWPRDKYRPGTTPPSFDKQYVRDFMDSTGWKHEPPARRMPSEVIANTRAKYIEAYELVTDQAFSEWYVHDACAVVPSVASRHAGVPRARRGHTPTGDCRSCQR